MGWLIDKICSWFCKHEFEHVQRVTYADCVVNAYICKKCGKVVKITT